MLARSNPLFYADVRYVNDDVIILWVGYKDDSQTRLLCNISQQ